MNRVSICFVTFCMLAGTGICRCQEQWHLTSEESFSDSTLAQRLANLEAEVEALRAENSVDRHTTYDSRCGACCRCCPTSHFEVGAEVAFLAPHSTTGLGPSGIAAFPSNDIFPSWRTWLGFQLPNKLGVRARYWEFNQNIPNDFNSFEYALDAYLVDLELTYSKAFNCNCDLLLSGGLRHLGFREERTFNATSFVESDLTGVVLGAELTHALFGWMRVYANTRTAAVFGETTGEVPSGFVILLDNTYAFMWEGQLGLELTRETRVGELALKVGAEVQHWNNVTYKYDDVGRDPESLGFVGVVTGVTLRR